LGAGCILLQYRQSGLRLTIRAGEQINGKEYGPKPGPAATNFTTYVWVYEW
jgi:hypothetical protein